MGEKILVAMSGGVDSAAAAILLKEQGNDVAGVTLRLTDSPDGDGGASAVASAAQAAERLHIRHIVLDLRDEFRRQVIDPFAGAYLQGVTPNPCVICNRTIKFGRLLTEAQALGYDLLATGHYATLDISDGRPHLLRAADTHKDQTYVLYSLSPEVLAHVRFPLGNMHKADIRRLAESHGFVSAHRKDSQDICFIPDGDYVRYLTEALHLSCPPGRFVDEAGHVLGTHPGYWHFTVGQRKGLGMGFGRPMFVLRKDAESGDVTLGDEAALFSDTLLATSVNWIEPAPTAPIRVTAKTRYSQKEAPATVTVQPDGDIRVQFDTPQRAITPGQSVVLYNGDRVVGGGIIRL